MVGIGLKDLFIIETNDVLLVANKENSQDVKDIVKNLRKKLLLQKQVLERIYNMELLSRRFILEQTLSMRKLVRNHLMNIQDREIQLEIT